MSKTYVAVQRSGQKQNELTHWKYIKREKKNGKWRYYYDRDSLKSDIGDAVWDAKYEVTSRLDDAKNNFEWGYEKGSKKDPNTGSVLNKKNIDPEVYERSARASEEYRRALATDPWYRGEGYKERSQKQIKSLEKEIQEDLRSAKAAKSFMGKLGQITGRKVTEITYNHNKVKNWLNKKLGIH